MDHGSSAALVIGTGLTNGLGIARNLGRRGIPVYCVTSNPYELTCYSKYCSGYAIIPDVESDSASMKRVLTAVFHHVGHDCVLFPTSDNAVLTFTQIRDTLPYHRVVLPSRARVRGTPEYKILS